jgi:hypothetical protein
MTKRIQTLGGTFRRLATRHDEQVLRHEDSPDAATDILGDEVERLAWAIARIPNSDLDGFRIKAAVYAHYRGRAFDENSHDVTQAILRSLLDDLLRNTPDYKWLTHDVGLGNQRT